MSATPYLSLPLMTDGQSGKYLTFNEAIYVLEIVAARGIIDRDLSVPPGSPAEGDAYIPKATATAAWLGKEGDLAMFINGTWLFLTPQSGLSLWVQDEEITLVFTTGGWANRATLDFLIPIVRVVGNAHTLTLADNGAEILFDSTGACTLTAPQASTEALPEGFQIMSRNKDTGSLTLAKEGSDTITGGTIVADPNVPTSLLLETAGSPNEWISVGDLT